MFRTEGRPTWVVLLLLTLVIPSTGTAEPLPVPRRYFDIVPVALSWPNRSAPAEPPAAPSRNAAGDLAFVATDHGRKTLFLRVNGNGMTGRVLAAGDPLEGSTVVRLVTMANSLGPYQEILFFAALANGRKGLFRASPQPRLRSVSPQWGYRNEPLYLRLSGVGFGPDVRIHVGDVRASITFISPTELIGVVSTTARVGAVDISVSRPGRGRHVLAQGLELRDRPASGCRGFWPDHQPPAVTASSMISGWIAPWGIVALYGLRRRLRRRAQPRTR